MTELFLGNNLRLARLFKDLTLNDVANELGITRQYVSKWETSQAIPNENQITDLSRVLNVDTSFFHSLDPKQVSDHQFHFRKLRTTKVRTKDLTVALGDIFRRLAEYIDHRLELPIPNFPSIEIHSDADIEKAAELCRKHWHLGLGPIDNMTRVAENAGALITDFDGISNEVDALSIDTSRPIIVRNKVKTSPGRLRFDIAHEVGHFVMHEGKLTGDKKTESEANGFASAFLLPRSSFLNDFPVMERINWKHIAEIKRTYKVSKAAILYRAKQLGRISDKQYVGAVIRLRKHEGKIEKDDYLIEPIEQPEMIHNAMTLLKSHMNLSVREIESDLGLGPDSLSRVIGPRYLSSDFLINSRHANVIPFPRAD